MQTLDEQRKLEMLSKNKTKTNKNDKSTQH